MAEWQTVDTKVPYQNKWLKIREDSVINPIGKPGIYGVVELANDVVYIVPVDSDGNFYLIQQFRYPIEKVTWEFPAGQTDGENPEIAARREFVEETGFTSSSLHKLGVIAVDTGFCKNMAHLFIAQELTKETEELDALDGIIKAKPFSFEEIRAMIMNGEIICPHTITAFYMASEYLKEAK